MGFSVVDAGGLLLAAALGAVLVALPGFALARLFGLARAPAGADPMTAVVAALATLPAIDSLATRFLGLDVALAATLGLALAGLVLACREGAIARSSRLAAGLLAAWLALLVVEWIDFDVAGRLYQPLTVIDTVKHAATTQAILDSGAPPRDAFFLRPERASYYYFFYTLAALIQRAGCGLVDARAAVGGLVFWVGIGLYGLVRLVLDRAGIALVARGGARMLLVLAVLAAGGLDVVAVLLMAWRQGFWLADPMQWNAQVSIWSESLLWVPHHVTGLIASVVALIALSDLAAEPQGRRSRPAQAIALAALSVAAALGLSVWVALGFVATAGVWGIILLVERRWRPLGLLAIAGVAAVAVAAPQLIDLHGGRSGAIPIALEVRAFAPVDALVPDGPWRTAARLLALPVNYLIEFGVLAVGTWLYWRRRGPAGAPTEFARVLTIAAVACLFLGSVARSLLFNNDLGWRIMLFPLLAGTIWTIAALDDSLARAPSPSPRPLWRRVPAVAAACLALGWTTSLAALFSMRAYAVLPVNPVSQFVAADPQTEHALRVAYGWAATNLPRSAVLQHNPTRRRALAFGVYGRNPTALSDRYGSLYGADIAAVAARLAGLAPIYQTHLPAATVRAIAERDGIDDLVVTAADPIWAEPGSFVWEAKPVYASDRVRIIPVTGLGG